jgi:hypothetical protein
MRWQISPVSLGLDVRFPPVIPVPSSLEANPDSIEAEFPRLNRFGKRVLHPELRTFDYPGMEPRQAGTADIPVIKCVIKTDVRPASR